MMANRLPSPVPIVANDWGKLWTAPKREIKPRKGWRLEKTVKGFYRWRWQRKNADGSPMKYTTKSGKTGYKRGSKYLPKGKYNGQK